MSEKGTTVIITGESAHVIGSRALARRVDESEALKGIISNYKFLADAAFDGRNVVLIDPITSEREQVAL